MALLGGMFTALYPALDDVLSGLDEYPEDVLRALGLEGTADLATAEGYLQIELFSIMAPIAIIAFATILGVNAIAGSERKGEMELILANPISRATVYAQRFAAMLVSTMVLGFVLWVVLAIGIPLNIWPDLSNWNLVQTLISLVLLGWAFGSLGFCLSGATGNSTLSYGIVGALALGTFVISSFAQIVKGIEPLKWISPFHYYIGSDPLTSGLNWWYTLVPLGVAAVTYVVGQAMFDRRDLKQAGS
jgi:ABC-2 type transport system permease protein